MPHADAPLLAGLTADELLHEVLVRPRDAHVPYDDLREVVRPGWRQCITPSFHRGGLNSIDLAVLDPADADRTIDAAIAEYDALGICFRWNVGPDSRPSDLGLRLERRGLKPRRLLLLAAAIADLILDDPPDIDVAPVDEHNLAAYVRVVATGWDVPAGPLLAYERAVLDHRRHAGPGAHHQSFLATIAGEPVGAANGCCFPRSLYLMGAVVLPSHRGRRVYRSLIAARLRMAHGRGVALVTCQALADTSAPILTRSGFFTVGEQSSFSR